MASTLRVCALAYFVLQGCLVRHQGPHGPLAKAIAPDAKGQASPLLYVLGIAATWFITPWAGLAFFVAVALMWLTPDRRIENAMSKRSDG